VEDEVTPGLTHSPLLLSLTGALPQDTKGYRNSEETALLYLLEKVFFF
jgi:hypothetical protein